VNATQKRPIGRFRKERLLEVQHLPPYRLESLIRRQVANDALIRFESNRYSVPWRYVGTQVELRLQGEELLILTADEVHTMNKVFCHFLGQARHVRLDHDILLVSGDFNRLQVAV
jgi:hypothetical protein